MYGSRLADISAVLAPGQRPQTMFQCHRKTATRLKHQTKPLKPILYTKKTGFPSLKPCGEIDQIHRPNKVNLK